MPEQSSLLTDVLKTLAGTLIGLIPYLVQTYRNRKKSRIDEEETTARTDLARVSARSVELHDHLAAGEGMGKLLSVLIESGDTIHQLQEKVFRLEQDKLGDGMLHLDLKKAVALLAFHNIRFHEAEHPEVKKMVEQLNERVRRQ